MFTVEKSEILTYKYSSVMPQPTNKDDCHFDIQPSSRVVRYLDESLYYAFTSHFLIHTVILGFQLESYFLWEIPPGSHTG